jgi:hypothetical protein
MTEYYPDYYPEVNEREEPRSHIKPRPRTLILSGCPRRLINGAANNQSTGARPR